MVNGQIQFVAVVPVHPVPMAPPEGKGRGLGERGGGGEGRFGGGQIQCSEEFAALLKEQDPEISMEPRYETSC